MGVSQNEGYLFREPNNKRDYSILGWIPPIFGKYHVGFLHVNTSGANRTDLCCTVARASPYALAGLPQQRLNKV